MLKPHPATGSRDFFFFLKFYDTKNESDLTTTNKVFWNNFYGSQSGIKLWYGLSINPVPIYTCVVWYVAWLDLAWKA